MVKMSDVWDRTTEFLSEHLAVLLPIVILGLFVPTSIAGALDTLRPTAGPGLKLALGILSIAFGILSLWVQLAIVALVVDPARGKQVMAVATARLLPAIGVFLLLLVCLGALFVPMGFLMAGIFDLAAMQTGTFVVRQGAAGLGIGLLAYGAILAIVMLFVGARLMPLTAVVATERRGVGAIPRAWRLTRGLTWRLVGVLILYAIVATVSVLAAQTVFGSVLRIFAGGEGPITVAGVITAIVVAAVSAAFTTLAAVFAAKLYVAIVGTPQPVAEPYPDIDAVLS